MHLQIPVMVLVTTMLAACHPEPVSFSFKGDEPIQVERDEVTYKPAGGIVDNAGMAAEIANIIAIRHYGKSLIDKERPFLVTRNESQWIVRGSFNEGPFAKGGTFEIRISVADGRIEKLIHEE